MDEMLAVDPRAYTEAQRAWLRRVWFDHTDRPMPDWLAAPRTTGRTPGEEALDPALIPILAA
jgi:hypothetical protein